jgi:outer membrane receptor for ferrienterochelin and colicins
LWKYKFMRLCALIVLTTIFSTDLFAQNGGVKGSVVSKGAPVEFANVNLEKTTIGATADAEGRFEIKNVPPGKYKLHVSFVGFKTVTLPILVVANKVETVRVELQEEATSLDEIVVTGTMKEVRKIESPVPVEIYAPTFFRKNPTPNLFDALQNVNGVRPQLNCNVCNTGDIHINGLEGPYTMILIDGMPIVSGLSTVYGLSGIPNSLVDRIEIVKGPASSLYGSEAIGGLINVITKNRAAHLVFQRMFLPLDGEN